MFFRLSIGLSLYKLLIIDNYFPLSIRVTLGSAADTVPAGSEAPEFNTDETNRIVFVRF